MRQSLKAFDFIKAEVKAGRKFPTATAVAAHMGWRNACSGNDCLMRLAANGWLEVKNRELSGRGWKYTYAIKDGP